jgi:hypothetical protein
MDITDTKVEVEPNPYQSADQIGIQAKEVDKPVFNPSASAAQWNQQKQTRSTVDTIEDNMAATIEANPVVQKLKKRDTLAEDA